MNQNLLKITDFLQETEQLTVEEKASLAKAVKDTESEMAITAFKLDRTEKVKRTTAILLEETIEELEQKRKAVEVKNRELEIEAALERVRTVALSMQNPSEMAEVCRIISEQLEFLKVKEIRNVQTAVIDQSKGTYVNYEYYARYDKLLVTEVSYKTHHLQEEFALRMLKGAGEFFSTSLIGQKVKDWYEYQKTTNQFADPFLEEAETLNYYMFSLGQVALGISTYSPLIEGEINLFKRFRNVFELAYRRFLDIQKAEAQARESQIQLALERVRARTMAMQRSDEMAETAAILFEQFIALGEMPERMAIEIVNEAEHVFEIWATEHGGKQFNSLIKTSLDEPYVMQKMYRAWKERTKSITIDLQGNELEEYFQFLKKMKLPVDRKIFGKRRVQNVATFSRGILTIITPEPRPRETIDILERFAAVFDGTYTRFLDLQKAEAQARESQIQLALERVRARTMAMQHSDELADASHLLERQVTALGIKTWGCAFHIFRENDSLEYHSNANGVNPTFVIPRTYIWKRYYEACQRGETLIIEERVGEECTELYEYMAAMPIVGESLQKMKAAGIPFPTYQVEYAATFKYGYLLFITFEKVPEAHDIFIRFAKVFEQTYTRFLDLQKAEAQAREAQIEAALERVRSRTMGMQYSTELAQTALLMFEQIQNFGVHMWSCGFNIWKKEERIFTSWMSSNGVLLPPMQIPLTENIAFIHFDESRQRGDSLFVDEMSGEVLENHYRYMTTLPGIKEAFDVMADEGLTLPSYQINHLANFSNGNLMFITYEPCPQLHDIFKRFAKVFEQTYTRFLDLQKAEAQAREAVKQSSLDRVRGQIASMRNTQDLERITPIIWHELNSLDVPFIRCGVFIMDEEKSNAKVYLSTPEGHSLAVLNLHFESNELTLNTVASWRKGSVYKVHWNKDQFIRWAQSLIDQGQVQNRETYQASESAPEKLDLHFVPFNQGMLYVGNTSPLSDDKIKLVKVLAEAFSIAYARYEDFDKLEKAKVSIEATLTELKATQSQLIQSEKMASLGELTAGIAHEIQNPLNFVNNFSEVSKELLDEMKTELDNGNTEDAKELANDVILNLEKINHHGKRADAIVKGMLQHSRTSTGQKEPTDINSLADEYLRLAYHGLRAKDKSFNATMNTDFDESIGKIDIIPQDIGRVILNLITNAFYAAPLPPEGGFKDPSSKHEPTIWVSTKKVGNEVLISVRDNGPGIPSKILDKIFQPFFTTKPTGQGTGLGLSLSYDIVKAHGGELKVETKEGEGSKFIIQIPIN